MTSVDFHASKHVNEVHHLEVASSSSDQCQLQQLMICLIILVHTGRQAWLKPSCLRRTGSNLPSRPFAARCSRMTSGAVETREESYSTPRAYKPEGNRHQTYVQRLRLCDPNKATR